MRRTLDDMEVTDRRTALLHFLDGATTDELDDIKAALAEIEARADADPGTSAPRAAPGAARSSAATDCTRRHRFAGRPDGYGFPVGPVTMSP